MKLIERALLEASTKYPYYSRGFFALTIVAESRVPTCGVDKYWRLYYNQKFLEDNKYTLVDVMRHELEHLLREHSDRVKSGWNKKRWNVACDCEINDELENLPSDACYPSLWELEDHNTAEFYYENLPEINISLREGSGVTGEGEEWELDPKDGDVPAIEADISEQLRKDIAEDVKDHARKDPGSVPNGILVWAEAIAKGKLPTIRWQNIVAKRIAMIANGRSDYTFSRISRRQNRGERAISASNIRGIPSCAVVVDTSGSMDAFGNWICGCVRDVIRMFPGNALIIDCDADVHAVRKLRTWRDATKSLGGGGTDMRVGIAAALKTKADIILVLTDGYTPWPEKMDKRVIPIINDGKNL